MTYYCPAEPEFDDAEWDTAREQLADDLVEDGYSRAEAYRHIDDLMVHDQCRANREDRQARAADEWWARAKNGDLT